MCPADACQINDLFCPVGEQVEEKPKFQIVDNSVLDLEQIKSYEKFLKDQNITVAGIEFIKAEDGTVYTYDINTNTNYNSDAEARAGKYGMLELATFLGKALEKEQALV